MKLPGLMTDSSGYVHGWIIEVNLQNNLNYTGFDSRTIKVGSDEVGVRRERINYR